MKDIHLNKRRDQAVLLIILVTAFVLRFWHLTFQSLWLDELHTMNEADPSIPWGDLWNYLKCCDQHPPLFFILERFLFLLFGHNETVARSLTASAGVVSVWVMYLLGKELLNKNLGLIVAALTCVNYYDIYYSQEARDYILVFLFSALSYLYFIRLVRGLRRKDIWPYVLCTLLMMYSHYYGLFIVCSQFVIAFILMLSEKEKRKTWLTVFGISGLAILVGFAPWLPFLRSMSQIKSFWISDISTRFYIIFFRTYFGGSDNLILLLYGLLIFYTLCVLIKGKWKLSTLKSDPLPLSFLVVVLSVLITYLVPYLRSLYVVPMLFDRYTIVVLPLFLLVIAYGIELIRYSAIKYLMLAVLLFMSLKDIVVDKKFYSEVHKTQFRELTAFITSDTTTVYPVLNDRTSWQHQYYLNAFGYKGSVFAGKRADVIDSFLVKSSPKYDVKGFWLMNAHAGPPPETFLDSNLKKSLDSVFVKKREIRLYDAWAQLYERK
jgi:uncharacterized membrane protein